MKENKLYEEDSRNHNWLTKNAITQKNMILEKFRKKNHQTWSHEGKIPVTNFNSELKREISHIVVFFTSPTWHNSKNNFNAQRSHKRLCFAVVVPGLYLSRSQVRLPWSTSCFYFPEKWWPLCTKPSKFTLLTWVLYKSSG